ncbi:ABC transporter permease [Solicola gregarius]|uniref:ABC transporter permease n=1 Tax=Solicola gregarius TaxID=2908642 RepID=A0AA46YJ64_9ACTN|nr:ABC transporter permease [Solicola gregarius]UYM03957.1 ABC transporter permease [Solicola gregarius]
MSEQETAEPSRPKQQARPSVVSEWIPTVWLTFLSIVLALVVGAVLIVVSSDEVISSLDYFFSYPWDTISAAGEAIVDSYWALLDGSFGSGNAIASTLERAAPLACAGLGVTLAFRVGLFNIGAQGQIISGSICAAYVGFTWDLPPVLHLIVALFAGLLGGAIWGGIVGVLKSQTGAHEVIVTIMLNYVALAILRWLLTLNDFQVPGSNNPKSPVVDGSASFPDFLGVHSGVFVALLAAVGVWWLLSRSTLGFEMRAVGANPAASRTAGMSVARAYTLAMVIAGLLAGLAGTQQVLGHDDPLTDGIAGSLGFDAITVSLLGRATPSGTVLAAVLFGALSTGGRQMQASTGTPLDLTTVLQAMIVLFVAAPALVRSVFRVRAAEGGGAVLAKGWNA